MKVKHRNLEQIRKSPETASLLGKEEGAGGKSMVRYWDWAVGHYHQEQNLTFALDYLQNGIDSFNHNRVNRDKGEKLLKKLEKYATNYSNLGFSYIKSNSRLNLNIQHNNFITGEIFRIDKTQEGGYAITLINRKDEIWAHELRFRLLQIHFSDVYKCPFDLVKVGVYNFENEDHEYLSFDDLDLKSANEEILGISSKINQVKL